MSTTPQTLAIEALEKINEVETYHLGDNPGHRFTIPFEIAREYSSIARRALKAIAALRAPVDGVGTYGPLLAMLDEHIEREGGASSFSLRSGYLRDLVLKIRPTTPPASPAPPEPVTYLGNVPLPAADGGEG